MHYLWRRSGLSKSQSKEIFQAARLLIMVQTAERLAALRAMDGCTEQQLTGPPIPKLREQCLIVCTSQVTVIRQDVVWVPQVH